MTTTASTEQTASNRRTEVLVVDDNVDAADTLHQLLTALGYSSRRAYDGATAMQLARQRKPDVAILDLRMPAMDGFELGRQLLALPELHDLPLVALSGDNDDRNRQLSRSAGFRCHLPKPTSAMHMTQVLDSLHRPQ